MLFQSLQYALFLPSVVIAYFALPQRHRWMLMLSASYVFYCAWKPAYGLIMLGVTALSYFCALGISYSTNKTLRRWLVTLCLVGIFSALFLFKYFNFLNENLRLVLERLGFIYTVPGLDLLLPIGISFFTFQSASYVIDVYRQRLRAEEHFGIYALYVSFFPQLVAGPIERSMDLLPQFRQQHSFDYDRVASGLRLIAWGLFKKLVIADQLAVIVDNVYNQPASFQGLPLIIATYCFAYQIYCDFSAYSDIAIGSARILGIRLSENFRQPYFSQSIPEFWQRWHITLSSWFRDYIYIPLGGNRVNETRWYANLMIVFLISGLWHGANWTFLIWGALHGMMMVITVIVTKRLSKYFHPNNSLLLIAVKTVFTFHLVCFAWVFFRANSLADAWYILRHMFVDLRFELSLGLGLGLEMTMVVFACVVAMELVEYARRNRLLQVRSLPPLLRWSAYYVLIMMTIIFGALQSQARFIYFQF